MATESPDDALVARARQGDAGAFEELVRRHADRLHAVVHRPVNDEQEAQEITQETFLRAWRGIGGSKARRSSSRGCTESGSTRPTAAWKQTADAAHATLTRGVGSRAP